MTTAEIPLSMAATGKPLRFVRVDAGRGLIRRLADLGLTPGAELQRVDASEAWSASGILHGRGLGGFLGGWRGRRFGGRGGRGSGGGGFFGRQRRGRRGRAPEGTTGGGLGPFGHRRTERFGGAVVVEFRGSKYVLGYGVSEKIVVSEE